MNKRTMLSGDEARAVLDDHTLKVAMERLAASSMGLPLENPDIEAGIRGVQTEFREEFAYLVKDGERLRNEGRFIVALDGNAVSSIVAHVPIGETRDGRIAHFITRLVTLPEHAGKGGAQAVLQEVEKRILEEDPNGIVLVNSRVPSVQHLCGKRGFGELTVEQFVELRRNAGARIGQSFIDARKKEPEWKFFYHDPQGKWIPPEPLPLEKETHGQSTRTWTEFLLRK